MSEKFNFEPEKQRFNFEPETPRFNFEPEAEVTDIPLADASPAPTPQSIPTEPLKDAAGPPAPRVFRFLYETQPPAEFGQAYDELRRSESQMQDAEVPKWVFDRLEHDAAVKRIRGYQADYFAPTLEGGISGTGDARMHKEPFERYVQKMEANRKDEIDAASRRFYASDEAYRNRDTGQSRLASALNTVGKSFQNIMGGAVQSAGELLESNVGVPAEGSAPLTGLGQAMRETAGTQFPTNPAYRSEVVADMIPGAIGSIAGMATGAAVGGPLAGGAVMGAATFQDSYDQLIAKGVPPDEARVRALAAAASETALETVSGKILSGGKALKGVAGEALTEGAQYAASQPILGEEVDAVELLKTMAVGGIVGGGAAALKGGADARQENRQSEDAARKDVQGLLSGTGEAPRGTIVSMNKTREEREVLLRPLSTEEATTVATQGLDVLEQVAPPALPEGAAKVEQTPQEMMVERNNLIREGASALDPRVRELERQIEQSLQQDRIMVTDDQGNFLRWEPAEKPAEGQTEVNTQGETAPTRNLGPGAANIEEFGPKQRVAAYNAAVDESRAAKGLEPVAREARKSDQTTLDNAEQMIADNPALPERLVDDLLAGRQTTMSDELQMVMTLRKADLQNKIADEFARIGDENLSSEERREAENNAARLEEQMGKWEEANSGPASALLGRALRSRQIEINDDLTLATQVGKARASKQEALTPVERTKVAELSKEGTDAQQELKDAEERAMIDQALREAPTFDSRVWKYAERLTKKWEDIGAKAWQRFQSKMARTSVNIDPTLLADLVLFARGKIARGLYNLAKFTSDVISGAGEGARDYIQPAWDAAQKEMDSLADADVPKQFREKVKKILKTKEEIATTRMEKRTAELEGKMAAGDFTRPPRRQPLDLSKDPRAVAAKARLTSVQKEFKKMQRAWVKSRRSNYEKTTDALWTGFTAERALMGSGDLSAPRQGARMAYSHPVMAARAMARSILTIFSQKRALGYEAARQLRPNSGEYKRMRMQQPGIEAEAHSRAAEEGVRSTIEDWADIKLSGYRLLSPPHLVAKLLGSYVKASSRTFTTFLNELSADVADFRLAQVNAAPMTKVEAEALGDMINSARGRGLKQGAGKLAQFLFYSANFLAARAKNLSGYHVWRRSSSMRIRKIALKEQVRALAGWLVVSNIARLFYGDKDDKETWEKKLKRMAGLTVTDKAQGIQYDYSGGEASIARIGAMLFDGIRQTIQSSKEKGDGQRAYRSQAQVGRQLRSKASPFLGVGMDWYFGSDYDGKSPTVLGSVKNITVPLTWRDADELFERAGFKKGTAAKVQEILGAGVTVKKNQSNK